MASSPDKEREIPQVIKDRIQAEKKLSFRDFMDMSLYDPTTGYYMSQREKIGWEGDYYTSPDVHRLFGISIMKQLVQMNELISPGQTLNVIEAGAGKGNLCADILDSAREREPSLYENVRYVIVEKSPALKVKQREKLESAGLLEKVEWATDVASALDPVESAVLLSNELIDAFPVHKVIFDGKEWKEIYVSVKDDRLCEVTAPLSSSELEEFLSRLEGPFEEGYTTEVNLMARDWIREAGESLRRGFIITIDYGYPREDYYSPLRNRGTLLCYHRHTLNEDPYSRVGDQDITAHLDFTSLAEAGIKVGLQVTGYCEQLHFLMGLGIVDELKEADEEGFVEAFQENQAIKRLLMPESMGGTFKVLIQHKGIDKPALMVFSFKDLSHRL